MPFLALQQSRNQSTGKMDQATADKNIFLQLMHRVSGTVAYNFIHASFLVDCIFVFLLLWSVCHLLQAMTTY